MEIQKLLLNNICAKKKIFACNKYIYGNLEIFGEMVTTIFKYFELVDYINTSKNVLYLDNNLEIKNKNIEKPIMFCVGGAAYLMYSKIFEKINKELNIINFAPLTHDFDISISLKDNYDIKTIDNDLIKLALNDIKNLIEKNNKILDVLEDIGTIRDEILVKINNKFYIVKNENQRFINYRIVVKLYGHIEHLIEIVFWKDFKITDNFFEQEFKKKRNIILFNDDKYYFYIPDLYTLLDTNYISIKNRFNVDSLDKCGQDYLRILYIFDTLEKIIKIKSKKQISNYLSYIFNIISEFKHILRMPYDICKLKLENKSALTKLYKNKIKMSDIEIIKLIYPSLNNDEKIIVDEYLKFKNQFS